MKRSLWMKLDVTARQLTPFGTTVLLTLVAVIPVNLTGLGRVSPLWPLIAVYVWSLNRPDLFPAVAAFVVGLLYELELLIGELRQCVKIAVVNKCECPSECDPVVIRCFLIGGIGKFRGELELSDRRIRHDKFVFVEWLVGIQ